MKRLTRRQLLRGVGGTAATLALVSCAPSQPAAAPVPPAESKPAAPAAAPTGQPAALVAQAPAVAAATSAPALPTTVPPGTKLALNISTSTSAKLQLELSGLDKSLPFEISEWVNLSAGPDIINAFRAGSLDLANNAGIPPIQAYYQGGGIDARIVGVQFRRLPTYVFATRPKSDIQSVADFKGKNIAFAQGQAQGLVLLRALAQAGLTTKDVTLVELNSPQFVTALQSGQVDVAPLQTTVIYQYLNQYAQDGAREIKTDVIDRLNVLWAPARTLANEAKVAAIAAYIPIWAKANVWQYQNPHLWIQKYFVENQGITAAQGKVVVDATGKPLFPPSWDEALKWEQETANLMAEGGFVNSFNTDILFDRRFEALAAQAVPEEYRS